MVGAMPSPRLQIAALAALALSACGSEPRVAPPQDPVLAAALADPLMTDMELAARNRGDDALSGNGLPEGGLPPWEAGPEEVPAARAAAVRLAGGTLRPPPSFDPGEGKGGAGEHAVTPVQIAARAGSRSKLMAPWERP